MKQQNSLNKRNKEDLVIDYSVSVKLQETEGKVLFRSRSQGIQKSGEKPSDKISDLSLGCMQSISPLAFIVKTRGRIKGFYNHKALIKKFESKRPELEDFLSVMLIDPTLISFIQALRMKIIC